MLKSLFLSLIILSLSSPAFSQDLNSALASHVCTGDWASAISDIDSMLRQAPAYRAELLAYRSRLLALDSASAPGAGCSGSVAPQNQPVEEYKVKYSGSDRPGLPSVSSDLGRQAQEMLPNR